MRTQDAPRENHVKKHRNNLRGKKRRPEANMLYEKKRRERGDEKKTERSSK